MDVLFRPAGHRFNRAKIEEHSHRIRRREEAVLILFGRMQADVEMVIAGRKNHVVRHEVAVLMSDLSMVAWSQNYDIAVWSRRNRQARDHFALSADLVAVAAGRWIRPVPVGAVC
jgi:hypothetical protein